MQPNCRLLKSLKSYWAQAHARTRPMSRMNCWRHEITYLLTWSRPGWWFVNCAPGHSVQARRHFLVSCYGKMRAPHTHMSSSWVRVILVTRPAALMLPTIAVVIKLSGGTGTVVNGMRQRTRAGQSFMLMPSQPHSGQEFETRALPCTWWLLCGLQFHFDLMSKLTKRAFSGVPHLKQDSASKN